MEPAVAPHLIRNDLVSTFSVQVPVGKTFRVHFTCEPAAAHHQPLLITVNTHSQPQATHFVTPHHQSLFTADFRSSFTKILDTGEDGYGIVRHLVADIGSFTMMGKLADDAIERILFFGFLADPDSITKDGSIVTGVEQEDQTTRRQTVDPDLQPYRVTVTATILDCLYWNKQQSMWKNDGCWVSYPNNGNTMRWSGSTILDCVVSKVR